MIIRRASMAVKEPWRGYRWLESLLLFIFAPLPVLNHLLNIWAWCCFFLLSSLEVLQHYLAKCAAFYLTNLFCLKKDRVLLSSSNYEVWCTRGCCLSSSGQPNLGQEAADEEQGWWQEGFAQCEPLDLLMPAQLEDRPHLHPVPCPDCGVRRTWSQRSFPYTNWVTFGNFSLAVVSFHGSRCNLNYECLSQS